MSHSSSADPSLGPADTRSRPPICGTTPLSRNRSAALSADGGSAGALAQVLNDTTNAAYDFIADLRANPEEIWRYGNAVHGALEALHLNEGDIASARVADERLDAQSKAMDTMAQLNLGLGVVEVAAAHLMVIPPVAVVFALVSAGVGVAELVEGFVDQARQGSGLSGNARSRPSLRFEGGSYWGVVIGAVFILLQLRGPGALSRRRSREPLDGSREADRGPGEGHHDTCHRWYGNWDVLGGPPWSPLRPHACEVCALERGRGTGLPAIREGELELQAAARPVGTLQYGQARDAAGGTRRENRDQLDDAVAIRQGFEHYLQSVRHVDEEALAAAEKVLKGGPGAPIGLPSAADTVRTAKVCWSRFSRRSRRSHTATQR